MKGKLAGKLTYANVMATIAVFIALGGASYAATQLKKNSVGTKQIRDNAVTGSKVKNNSLTGSDIAEPTLGQVPNANSADPAAFARVSAAGAIDQAQSKNVGSAAVTVTGTGSQIYCFTGLPFSPRGGQVTVDYLVAGTSQYAELGIGEGAGCPSGTQAIVWTHSPSNPNINYAAFYVAFYR